MGLRYRKSIKLGKGIKLNLSKSGVSTSIKVGNTTYNSKKGTTVNLGNGLTYHSSSNNNRNRNKTIKDNNINVKQNKFEKVSDTQKKKPKTIEKIILIILWSLALFLFFFTISVPQLLIPSLILTIIFGMLACIYTCKIISKNNIEYKMLENNKILDIEQNNPINNIK